MPRQGLFVLFVHSPQLPCFFLVITDISPRDAIDPEWIRITEFADQEIPVKIRYHGYIPGIPVVTNQVVLSFVNSTSTVSILPF